MFPVFVIISQLLVFCNWWLPRVWEWNHCANQCWLDFIMYKKILFLEKYFSQLFVCLPGTDEAKRRANQVSYLIVLNACNCLLGLLLYMRELSYRDDLNNNDATPIIYHSNNIDKSYKFWGVSPIYPFGSILSFWLFVSCCFKILWKRQQ